MHQKIFLNYRNRLFFHTTHFQTEIGRFLTILNQAEIGRYLKIIQNNVNIQ